MGISPNYFQVGDSDFLRIEAQSQTNGLSLAEQLYTPSGTQAIGLSGYLHKSMNMHINQNDLYFIEYHGPNMTYEYNIYGIFLLNTCPGMRFKKFVYKHATAGVISLPLFLKLTNSSSIASLPLKQILIDINDDSSDLPNALREISMKHGSFYVFEFESRKDTNLQAKQFLDYIFIIIIVIFMFLCFFSLSSTMTANIIEQKKELSVMRSIGITKRRTVILYIYEAFILVFSSSLVGVFIGILVGYTMCAQRQLYSDMPVPFTFPTLHLIIIFVCSIVCAIVSSLSPALYILNKPIAEIIKH